MSFTKQQTITVTAEDYIEKSALYHTEFVDKGGFPCLIQVLQDQDVESPRDWDNLWTWATTPNAGYSDVKPCYYREARKGYCQKYYYRPDDFHDESGCIDKEFKKTHLIVPLFLYRHSGDVISAGGYGSNWPDKQWDAGCMGFAFVSREKIKKEYNCKRITKKIIKYAMDCLNNEVKTMNAVNFGEVYGITVMNLETEEKDSCWNFVCPDYKDLKSCVAEMLCGWAENDEIQNIVKELLQ